MSSWSRTQAVFIKFKTGLFLIDSFVQLKINNQALETAFAPISPGEVFKVFGSEKSIKHHQQLIVYFLHFWDLIMAALMIMQNQNRMAYPCYIMDLLYQCVIYLPQLCSHLSKKSQNPIFEEPTY